MPKLYQILGTKNRKEQEERAQALLNAATKTRFAATIFTDGEQVRFEVVGDGPVTTKDIKEACYKTIEQLVAMEQHSRQQEEPPEPPDETELSEPLNDSEVPDHVQPNEP